MPGQVTADCGKMKRQRGALMVFLLLPKFGPNGFLVIEDLKV
jgi:hypothetical protein